MHQYRKFNIEFLNLVHDFKHFFEYRALKCYIDANPEVTYFYYTLKKLVLANKDAFYAKDMQFIEALNNDIVEHDIVEMYGELTQAQKDKMWIDAFALYQLIA
jgi:hypothetical protein